jgi:hypothetical protein
MNLRGSRLARTAGRSRATSSGDCGRGDARIVIALVIAIAIVYRYRFFQPLP